METLGKLDAAVLAQHAAAVVGILDDSDEDVRRAALVTLGKLDAAALAHHATAIVGMRKQIIEAAAKDMHPEVRAAASRVLGKVKSAR